MFPVAIGVHVHAEPQRLRETLAALRARTRQDAEILLLADGPDAETRAVLAQIGELRVSATESPLGAPACFNRLVRETTAPVLVFLESGTLVGPGWLEALLAALDADAAHGMACPSTNRAWNQIALFPQGRADAVDIAARAAEAQRRFGGAFRVLAPLWDLGDFCFAARRAAVEATGPADEAYGLGPCWEMDFAARAARAGFRSVWAPGAYVFRHPPTARRAREEARLFEASRRRYQDRLCGKRLLGLRTEYARHCEGEACRHFAPAPNNQTRERETPRPLVSCIMPTRGRPDWVPQAIRYFQRQSWPERELIVVDGGPPAQFPALPDDPRIRIFHVASNLSIGAMRNFGVERALGDVIVQWDDDDWYGPDRLSAQVRPIMEGEADITGLTDARFFDLEAWRFWRCSPALHKRMFVQDVSGGTLAFRRSLFTHACRYPDASLAEDAAFLQNAVHRGARLARLPSAPHYRYLRHGGNTWGFRCGEFLDPAGWIADDEPPFAAGDRAFYAARGPAARSAPAPAEPAPAAPPLISCIMPTRGRRRFVPGAIAMFLAQDHPNKELIVIDDGDDRVADLIPPDPRIRYIATPGRQTVGAKRNAACREAKGALIAHWDDDDWYAPWRLTYQWREMKGAEICGLNRIFFLEDGSGRAWEYAYPHGGWLAGATMVYRREFWARQSFAEIDIGEDNRFVAGAPPDRIGALERREFFIGRIHPGNVSPKQTQTSLWRQVDPAPVRALLPLLPGSRA